VSKSFDYHALEAGCFPIHTPAKSCSKSSLNRWTLARMRWRVRFTSRRAASTRIVLGKRDVTADTDLRLGPLFWACPEGVLSWIADGTMI